MKLRRFNDTGLKRFTSYLHELKVDKKLEPPLELLGSGEYSSPLKESIEAEPEAFASRLAFARWLHDAAERSGSAVPRADVHFWAWLTLLLFDQVRPVNGKGERTDGANARYLVDEKNWQRRYRHLLANPYDIYWVHRDEPRRALVALVNPLDKPGELSEQFGARSDIINCPGTLGLATLLYVDPATGERRKGASGAAARRFGKLMNQYARTFDLPMIAPADFAARLPREFDRFTRPVLAGSSDAEP